MINPLIIKETESTPLIEVLPDQNKILLEGESFPENVVVFYQPFFEMLNLLKEKKIDHLTVEVKLVYFNSSSVKILLNMFDILEEMCENGTQVTVNWYHLEDDDSMMEFGEDFSEDLEKISFHILEIQEE